MLGGVHSPPIHHKASRRRSFIDYSLFHMRCALVSMVQSRLSWACRRGMLELDVLLGNFLNEAFLGLDLESQALFTRLLESNDPDLFMWLMGEEGPTDPGLILIITKIREHAQNRNSAETF